MRTVFLLQKPLGVSIVSVFPDSVVEIEIRIIYLVSEVLAGIRVLAGNITLEVYQSDKNIIIFSLLLF